MIQIIGTLAEWPALGLCVAISSVTALAWLVIKAEPAVKRALEKISQLDAY